MAAMFTMMNNARLGVGVQGVGVAEARRSTRWPMRRSASRAHAEGEDGQIARSCRCAADAGDDAGRDLRRPRHRAGLCGGHRHGARHRRCRLAGPRGAADADRQGHGTDTGIAVANLGVQVHGGMGYIEETGRRSSCATCG
jgi:acyl-CoA dehydrogenase